MYNAGNFKHNLYIETLVRGNAHCPICPSSHLQRTKIQIHLTKGGCATLSHA